MHQNDYFSLFIQDYRFILELFTITTSGLTLTVLSLIDIALVCGL